MDNAFLQQAEVFMMDKAGTNNVIKAGEHTLISLYNGRKNETLDELRLRKFHEKTTCSTVLVQPRTLPPTSSAAKYHSLRVYLQVQVWLARGKDMTAENWGWKVSDGKMLPILTDLPPAPQRILEVIHCKCKTGCTTLKCTCRKNGMDCSAACADCQGMCANMPVLSADIDSDDDTVD